MNSGPLTDSCAVPKELQNNIREHVEAGAAIFSDELKSYDGLETDYQQVVS
jgi:hypothetical protein